MSEGKMSAEELAQAREVARKPHRFESAHPTKWSDLTERLLAHIATLQREADGMREALGLVAEKLPIMPDPDASAEDEIEIAITWREVSRIKHALANGSPQAPPSEDTKP